MTRGLTTVMTLGMIFAGSSLGAATPERQITTAPHSHVLTNVNVWTPDSEWIVYDVREGDAFNGDRIEQVNVRTGEVRRLYTSQRGGGCGVVTCSPIAPLCVFIVGPDNPTPEWSYGFTRRGGELVDARRPGEAWPLDAATYAPPFVPGALRGGTHVHVFSPDGMWISFTYEDEVLARLGPATAEHDANQRNIGLAIPAGAVRVPPSHPRNRAGDWFSVVVTHTVAAPRPGSDEISRACEEGWIGTHGYLRTDGTMQRRALAFQGTVTALDGSQHAEVFVVDLPDNPTRPGLAPLEGTATRWPAPPHGTQQRRITFTTGRKFPGVASTPRHWLRCSPNGAQIAFLMKDDAGVVQLWTVSPNGGAPRQVTHNPTDIASAFTWSPDGRSIAHVMDGSVCVTDIATGHTQRLTPPRSGDSPSPLACVFSPDGRAIAYTRGVVNDGKVDQQIFVVEPRSP